MFLLKDVLVLGVYFISLYFAVFWILFLIDKYNHIVAEKSLNYIPKKFDRVTIAVPCYNEEKTIKKTLLSLLNLDYPHNLVDIIVINDGSFDRTEEKVKDVIRNYSAFNIKYFKIKNGGKAAALNFALKKAKGTYFVCLDADSHVDKRALSQAIGFIQKDKDLAIITPVMHVYNPKKLIQKLQKIEYVSAMLLVKLMGYIDSNYIAPGPFSLYKTRVVKNLGGFDEYNLTEDQEIAYRVQTEHLKIRQCPTSIVYTNTPDSVHALYRQRNRWFKGTLQNLFKYKSLILNKKYGDFGYFQMPVNIFAFLLAIFAVVFLVYNIFKPIFHQIKYYYLINFDFWFVLKNLEFNFSFLDINILNYYIIFTLMLLAGILLYNSHKLHDKSIRSYGFLVLLPYFFLYYLLLSFFAVIVLLESLFKVKQKW